MTGGLINFAALNNFGTGAITLNGGGVQWATGNTVDISSRLAPLGAGGGTFDTNGNNVTLASATVRNRRHHQGRQRHLTLAANNTYAGGTTMTGGLINFASASNFGAGNILLNGGGLQWAAGSTADISSKLAPLGAGGGTFDTNGNTITFATGLTGSGGLAKQGLGTLNLTGNNTYTGGTAVLAGTLAINGSVAGNVAVGSQGTLGGNGTIGGSVVNAGTLAPGNSIGLLTVNGSYTQMAGSTYQVEVNNAGQGDRINVGGAAAIQGGTVQVLAAAGSYANSTTYTIVRATGGVSGTYAGVTSNFAFLTPTLSYDANDVFLTLALPAQNAFTPSFLALTPNQKAVGIALNQSFANACRRLRHGDRRAGRPQHRAGPGGARYDQRPALCRLRHDEHEQRRAVHECARPADGQRTRQQRQHRPAPGAGAGLRDRELRWRGPAQRVGECAGRSRHRAGRQQRLAPSPTTSAAPRPASTIASIRASSPASASATPTAPSG